MGLLKTFETIIQTCDSISILYGIEMIIKWTLGHADIDVNEKADTLACIYGLLYAKKSQHLIICFISHMISKEKKRETSL